MANNVCTTVIFTSGWFINHGNHLLLPMCSQLIKRSSQTRFLRNSRTAILPSTPTHSPPFPSLTHINMYKMPQMTPTQREGGWKVDNPNTNEKQIPTESHLKGIPAKYSSFISECKSPFGISPSHFFPAIPVHAFPLICTLKSCCNAKI